MDGVSETVGKNEVDGMVDTVGLYDIVGIWLKVGFWDREGAGEFVGSCEREGEELVDGNCESVGSLDIVGKEDGLLEGIEVGFIEIVGCEDGIDDTEGSCDGEEEGSTEGIEDGFELGIIDILGLWDNDGENEGRELGVELGISVGLDDGEDEGNEVGRIDMVGECDTVGVSEGDIEILGSDDGFDEGVIEGFADVEGRDDGVDDGVTDGVIVIVGEDVGFIEGWEDRNIDGWFDIDGEEEIDGCDVGRKVVGVIDLLGVKEEVGDTVAKVEVVMLIVFDVLKYRTSNSLVAFSWKSRFWFLFVFVSNIIMIHNVIKMTTTVERSESIGLWLCMFVVKSFITGWWFDIWVYSK